MGSNISIDESIKGFSYKTRIHYLKNDGRIHITPCPKDLSRQIHEQLDKKEVLVVVYNLDKPLKIMLPWPAVKMIKEAVLKGDEKEIKLVLAYTVWSEINSHLRMILPYTPSIELIEPEKIEIKEYGIDFGNNKTVRVIMIKATGFHIYPAKIVTESITVNAEIYNIPDQLDVDAHSYVLVVIDLKRLLELVDFKWEINRRSHL